MVYRASVDSTSISKRCDVYYWTPSMKKCRSLREVKEKLKSSLPEEGLSIENFTFKRQEMNLNDPSKELVRNANSVLSREKTNFNKYDKGK